MSTCTDANVPRRMDWRVMIPNQVERWFAELTRRKLRRSSHRSVKDLEADVTT